MPSTYKKGNLYEGEARKILEANGWIAEGQHRQIKYIPDFRRPFVPGEKRDLKMIMVGRDVFGCDIIAKRAGKKTLFIQVSVPDRKSAKIRQVMAYPWNFEHETVQIWLRREGERAFDVYEAPTFGPVGVVRVPSEKKIREEKATLTAA